MRHIKLMLLFLLAASFLSMGMALDCSRAADDDDFNEDDSYFDDDDDGDDDDDNDDSGDDDDNDTGGDDDDTGGDDDDDDDTAPPPPDGFLTGDWTVRGNGYCHVDSYIWLMNGIDGNLSIEHWTGGDILLYDGDLVGEGNLTSPISLDLTFEHAWGFERDVPEGPENWSMTMQLVKISDNNFYGLAHYETELRRPRVTYECDVYVNMRRQ